MKNPLRYVFPPVIMILPLLLSCSATGSIGISDFFLKGSADNWPMEGGGVSRNAARAVTVNPPLTLLWTAEASSAFTQTLTVSDSLIYASTCDARIHVFNLRNGRSAGKMKFNYSVMHGISVNHQDIVIAQSGGKHTLINYNVYDRKYNFIKTLGPLENNPLIYDDFIYIAAEKGVLYCLDYKDGNTQWSYTLPGTCHSSPSLYLNAIIIGCDDGSVRSLNRFRGTLNWSVRLHQAVMHPPVIDNRQIFVSTRDGRVYCLDAESGKILWSSRLDPYDSCMVYSSPAAGQDLVITASANGSVYALSRMDGTHRWTFTTRGAVSVTPVITPQYVYVGSQDSYLYAVNVKSGQQEWSFKTSGRIKTNPVIYGRFLVAAAENKSLYVFQSSAK